MWLMAVLWLAGVPAGAGEGPVLVRASRETAPCVSAALSASARWRSGARLEVAAPREGGPADVVVASAVELTRALEGGAAEPNTDRDLAGIPWVFRGAEVTASALPGQAVAVPDGPASYEARRFLREGGASIVDVARVGELHGARAALVPLSLAGEGAHRKAEAVPPLVARAALGSPLRRPGEARALLDYLASEAGQRAFAACGRP